MGHKHTEVRLDLSRSLDVIGHVTNRFATCPFLSVVGAALSMGSNCDLHNSVYSTAVLD